MQINRSLYDREVFAGDKLFDAQGRPYAFLEHLSDELVVAAGDGHPIRFRPKHLGCYVVHANRTERGLAKERLRDSCEDHCALKAQSQAKLGDYFQINRIINDINYYLNFLSPPPPQKNTSPCNSKEVFSVGCD